MARVVVTRLNWLFVLALVALTAACAGPGTPWRDGWTEAEPEAARCLAVFSAMDQAVVSARVGDGQWARVPGFPYVRVSRFLASYRDEVGQDDVGRGGWDAWVGRLADLDRQSRAIEFRNLPFTAEVKLVASAGAGYGGGYLAMVDGCRETLLQADLATVAGRERLRRAARVPADYDDWQRVAGLYPLTAIPLAIGAYTFRGRQSEDLLAAPATLPVRGQLASYGPGGGAPLAPEQVRALLAASRDALGVPEPTGAALTALVQSFAPVLTVDTVGDSDRPGAPLWVDRDHWAVNVALPAAYTVVSHTRFGGAALWQISYVFWFPARPRTGALDLLGGPLDGLIWRVTVGPDGRALAYDSIHPCGCYHTLFPAAGLERRERWSWWHEGVYVPHPAPTLAAGERMGVRLEAGSHYIKHIGPAANSPSGGAEYRLLAYDTLRSLPLPDGGARSLFAPDGLVPGSERGERYALWPSGIMSPGAMRQWGTHATAFVGRRHFDDAFLFDEVLRPSERSGGSRGSE